MKKLDFSDMNALKVVIAWRRGKKILISLARRIFPRPFLLSCFSSFFSPAWWLFQDDPWHLVSPCPLDTHWDLIFRETSAKTVETIEVGDKKSGACRKQGRAADNRGNALGDNRRREMPSIWTTLTQKSFFPGSTFEILLERGNDNDSQMFSVESVGSFGFGGSSWSSELLHSGSLSSGRVTDNQHK